MSTTDSDIDQDTTTELFHQPKIRRSHYLSIRQTLKVAWESTSGIKLPILLCLSLSCIIIIIIAILMTTLGYPPLSSNSSRVISLIVSCLLVFPLWVCPQLTALKRIRRGDPNYRYPLGIRPIRQLLSLGILAFISQVLLALSIILVQSLLFEDLTQIPSYAQWMSAHSTIVLVAPLVIIVACYFIINTLMFFSYLNVLDAKMNPFKALYHSVITALPIMHKLIALMLIIAWINIIGIACLLIGIVWSLPMSYLCYAQVYDMMKSWDADHKHT